MRPAPILAAILLAAAPLTACSIDLPEIPDVTASPTVATSTKTPAPPAETRSARCTKITTEFAQAILDGAPDGAPLKQVGDGYAVESTENPGNWFVAIQFKHSAGTDIGVWQALSLDGGPFRSVDGFANEFTQWPDSGNAGSSIVDEAKACIQP